MPRYAVNRFGEGLLETYRPLLVQASDEKSAAEAVVGERLMSAGSLRSLCAEVVRIDTSSSPKHRMSFFRGGLES